MHLQRRLRKPSLRPVLHYVMHVCSPDFYLTLVPEYVHPTEAESLGHSQTRSCDQEEECVLGLLKKLKHPVRLFWLQSHSLIIRDGRETLHPVKGVVLEPE